MSDRTSVASKAASPVLLPHIAFRDAHTPTFLGEPIAASDDVLAALAVCDGRRAWADYSPADQSRLAEARSRGLVVSVPRSRAMSHAGPRRVVVAPHPDDAALALGGLLAAGGAEVINVFSHEEHTIVSYYRERPAEAAALLVAEERLACRVLTAAVSFLGYHDAPLRAPNAPLFVDDAAASCSDSIVEAVASSLDAALPLGDETIVAAPLAVGGHVDHVVAREAVLRLAADGRIDRAAIELYEDMPYAVFGPADRHAAALATRLRGWGIGASLRPVDHDLDCDAVNGQAEALRCYRLQVTEGLRRRVRERVTRRADPSRSGVERTWRLARPNRD